MLSFVNACAREDEMIFHELSDETRPSGDALVRERPDGEFEIVCTKCGQVLAVAINKRSVYWSGGAVIGHRCGEPKS